MGCPMGLKKATNYYNKIEAWVDFRKALNQAASAGLFDKAILLYPSQNASWRMVDKATEKIRQLLIEVPAGEPAASSA